MEDAYQKRLKFTIKEINKVSPSFCIAKWKQVTMHLHNGHTHSCHHPGTHLVPIEEVKINPSALHNTEYKKELRKQMLEGVRPSECDYCWKAEDAGNEYSDRIYKSADYWAYPYLNDIVSKPWNDNVNPSYVEVSFSSVCNFKCSYCQPHISSQWMEEIERFGPYPTSTQLNNLDWVKLKNQTPIPNNQENPYMDAFWKWWPEMYQELLTFRVTGGEPLLSKDMFKVLDYIINNPNPKLILAINTNLNPPKELFDKFIEKLKIISDKKCTSRIEIYTSAEAFGEQAEYIRYGLNYKEWNENLERLINEVPAVSVSVTCTYNIFSVPSFKKFLQNVLDIRGKYRETAVKNRRMALAIDIPYLRFPMHQPVYILPENYLHYIEEQISFMEENKEMVLNNPSQAYLGFYPHEIAKLKRIYDIVKKELQTPSPLLELNRKDFIIFVDEHDRRRGTNFLKTFPEFNDLYHNWKKIL